MKLKGDPDQNLTGALQNDIRNSIKFHASSHKTEHFDFDRLALFKICIILNEKVQKCYVSRPLRVIQRKANS